MQVPEQDRRPTGAPQLHKAPALWQQQLNRAVAGDRAPALQEWGDLLRNLTSPTGSTCITGSPRAPAAHQHHGADDFTPLLAERLAAVSRAGLPARRMLNAALSEGPLPDDHASAALWWRLSRHLTPAVATQVRHQVDHTHTLNPDTPLEPFATQWVSALVDRVGQDRAELMRASSWWPTLVTSIDHALQRGWALRDVLGTTGAAERNGSAEGQDPDLDPCQAMVWRLSMLTDPPPLPEDLEEPQRDPRDNAELATGTWDAWASDQRGDVLVASGRPPSAEPSPARMTLDAPPSLDSWSAADHDRFAAVAAAAGIPDHRADRAHPRVAVELEREDGGHLGARLQIAAMTRAGAWPLQPSDAAIERQVTYAAHLDFAPVPAVRMLQVNRMTLAFFQARYPSSWAQQYLTDRLGQDPALHPDLSPHLQPGYAPPGWDTLVGHLRRLGVTDQEMTETGVATRARTGRLIDRFRDRAVMPIVHNGEILGFVGRRHPALTDHTPGPDQSRHPASHTVGPKYLNTADTPLFHKGAQLFGVVPGMLGQDATPVLVEGPLDAWAVTLATSGTANPYVGVAPLGTALTEDQAEQLAHLGRTPIVATDADLAGQVAAERDFWLLTPHGLDPLAATFPEGSDPADMLARYGPTALVDALSSARPLGDHLLQARLSHLTGDTALIEALRVAAARPPEAWEPSATTITARLGTSTDDTHRQLADAAETWNKDPRAAAAARLVAVQQVRATPTTNNERTPPDHADRWVELAHHIDPRLPTQGDWPALAAIMTLAHRDGYDVEALTRQLVATEPLGPLPAQDLRYRLVGALPLDVGPAPDHLPGPAESPPPSGVARDRRARQGAAARPTGRQR